ncbi:MAG: TonB-dependent receptor [Flavobacteriales bacterium]|nr:TonB-dependent receptor [Flavobacteriales bacterium]
MKRIVIFSLLCYCALYARAQEIYVYDSVTGAALEWVVIYTQKPAQNITTNASGKADISSFPKESELFIRLFGYKTEQFRFAELEKLSFKIGLERSDISLDQVVISTTRWKESGMGKTSRVVKVKPMDIMIENPQTTADALAISGEVFMQKSQQGGGSPMIRGFATNRLLYSVDGVRMNTAIFRSGNIQNVISLDALAMENIEVLFGPGSVLYGSDAIGGVMSFQTLTPRFASDDKLYVKGSSLARYSSANHEFTGHFHVNVGWKKWSLLTSISASRFGDLRMGTHGPDEYLRPFYVQRIDNEDKIIQNENPLIQRPSAYSQFNLMQKIAYKPNANWHLEYGFHYSETSAYGRYDRHIRYKNDGTPRSAEWNYGPQKWMMNLLTISHNKKNLIYDSFVLRIAHQYFNESRIDRNFGSSIRRFRDEKVQALSMNADWIKKLAEKHTLYYGLEGVMNHVLSSGKDEHILTNTKELGPSRYPDAVWSSWAAYLNYRFKISPKVSLSAGVRYNHFVLNADFTSNLSFYPLPVSIVSINRGSANGSLGIAYTPSDKWALSVNLATGFRAPNVDDLGKVFDSEAGKVTVPNTQLQSEYAYNVDVGIAKVFGDFLKLDLTGYATYLQNAMVRRNYQLNGMDSMLFNGEMSQIQAIQNAADAYVFGIQAGVQLKLPKGFSLSTKINWQKGVEEMDDGTRSPLRHAAPWFGVSRFSYTYKKLVLTLYSQYSGRVLYKNLNQEERGKPEIYAKDAEGNPYSPAWYTLNFKASYTVLDFIHLGAGIENITDIRYRPYSSGIAAPGRNFILSVRVNF